MSEQTIKELDVRIIPPRDKHSSIFRTFDALDEGEAFVIINDHDPKPLRYQFDAERTGEYSWEYEESGPEVFRVRLTRIKAAPEGVERDLPGGGCGGH